MTPITVSAELETIAAEIHECTSCELCQGRTRAVPGVGPATAKVLLVGEGPGWHEDQQGLPFVGNSGKYLSELLIKAGLSRDEVFITNVVKCRPPGNRDPLPDEIAACARFLDRQIAALDPWVVITLGRFSMSRWFPGERISKIHGTQKRIGNRVVIPMYHPAAALHQGSLRPTIEEDFARLPKVLAEVERFREKAAEEAAPPVSQGTLF